MTFDALAAQWEWKPIRNCPGRYVLAHAPSSTPLAALVGADATVSRFHVEAARDTVLVVALDTGGLISYERADGTCVHTLNDAEGFARKLAQLGIQANP